MEVENLGQMKTSIGFEFGINMQIKSSVGAERNCNENETIRQRNKVADKGKANKW